jgi:DNA polymerase-3 subunit beta
MTATATKARPEKPAVGGSVTFEREALVRAFSVARRVIPRRTVLPTTALGWLQVGPGGARLRATDPGRGLWLDLDVGASAPGQVFETLLPVREWSRTLATMDSEMVTVRRDGDVVSLTSEGVSFTWKATREPADMPAWPEFTPRGRGEVPAAALCQAFHRGLFAVASDDSRPVLASLYLATSATAGRRVVSADGFRLCATPFPWAGGLGEVLIPAVAARQVVGLVAALKPETVGMEVSERYGGSSPVYGSEMLRFEIGPGCVLHEEGLAGSFPNYEQIIPETFGTAVTLPATAVSRGLRMLEGIAHEGSGIVRMSTNPEGLTLQSRSDDEYSGSVRLLAAVEGPPARIAVNWRYFANAMAAIEGDVRIELPETPSTQMVFRSVSDPGFVQVVMPMFVQWGDE